MPRPGKRQERIRQVFEQGSFRHVNFDVLLGIGGSRAMAIEPGRSSSRHLDDAARPRVDVQAQMISRENAAGYVMQVNQGTAAVVRKSAHHLPRRLLMLHVHARAAFPRLEAQSETGL